MSNCIDCGKEMNPIEALLSGSSHRCGSCIRKLHKKVLNGE